MVVLQIELMRMMVLLLNGGDGDHGDHGNTDVVDKDDGDDTPDGVRENCVASTNRDNKNQCATGGGIMRMILLIELMVIHNHNYIFSYLVFTNYHFVCS